MNGDRDVAAIAAAEEEVEGWHSGLRFHCSKVLAFMSVSDCVDRVLYVSLQYTEVSFRLNMAQFGSTFCFLIFDGGDLVNCEFFCHHVVNGRRHLGVATITLVLDIGV